MYVCTCMSPAITICKQLLTVTTDNPKCLIFHLYIQVSLIKVYQSLRLIMTLSKADTTPESARTFDDSENGESAASFSSKSIEFVLDSPAPRSYISSSAPHSPASSSAPSKTYWDGLKTDCDIAQMEMCLNTAKACISRIKTRRGLHSETSESHGRIT